jgi:uncharacterized protein with FMN-binding domain
MDAEALKMFLKKFLCGASVLAFSLAVLSSCGTFGNGSSGGAGVYQDGEYEGTGQGLRGPVVIRIRIEGGAIAGLEIVKHSEDEFGGGPVMEDLAEQVLEHNGTAGIDAVSGATESGAGFLAAVEDALSKARQAAKEAAKAAVKEEVKAEAEVQGP